jgi:F0F1-type ATP synthase assembly protein I
MAMIIAWFRRVDEFVATAPVSLVMLIFVLIGIGLGALIVLAAR